MLSLFVICAVAGLTFTVGSFLMGQGSHHAGHGDAGHAEHDGASAHGGTHHPGVGHDLPILGMGPLSALVCGFGIGGFTAMELGLPGFLALLPALLLGGAMWLGTAWLTRAFFHLANAGRSVHAEGYLGEQATVSVSIPADGLGEITFTSQGEVVTAAARSGAKVAYAAGSVVSVDAMQDGVAVVGPPVEQVLDGEQQAARRAVANPAATAAKSG